MELHREQHLLLQLSQVGWIGAADITVVKNGHNQADFSASSRNFRVDSLVSFTWLGVLLLVQESLFSWKSESHFYLCKTSLILASVSFLLFIVTAVPGDWELRRLLFQNRQHKLMHWEKVCAISVSFPLAKTACSLGDMMGNRPFSDFQS